MIYGFFDDMNREYVITKPDTPAPWANYLGSPEYGAIISNNAGGYSFAKSGANGRISRYVFNQEDRPGRYIYLKDMDSKDYWTASWQPVGKDLKEYKSKCRHGMGYTILHSEYSGINSEVLYFVPLHKTHEIWRLRITNASERTRKISTFGYVEFTNDSNYEQDQINLQYTQFITRTYFKGRKILQTINESIGKDSSGSNHKERFFASLGSPIVSYNGDKTAFLGRYQSYGNPQAVEQGICDNTLNYNSNACGALHSVMDIHPGETKEIIFILGNNNDEESDAIIKNYKDFKIIEEEFNKLKLYWHKKLDFFHVQTPDVSFNSMVNTWNAYQCFITFIWSRAASFIYCGLRNGYGYRDTVQDIQGIIHLDPEAAAEKIRFMISAQAANGGGLPLVKFDHKAGYEDTPDEVSYVQKTGHPAYRADDALWLFPTIQKYIFETGNIHFLDEVIPYANGGKGSVYEHLQRAIQFSLDRMGIHNMPAGLHADWNDCLRLGKKGESTFVAMQLYYAMSILKEFANVKSNFEYANYINGVKNDLKEAIQSQCWDGDRYIRGFTEEGKTIGSKKDPEANIWLNPQAWAIISGIAMKEQAENVLNSVYRELNTAYGVRIMAPPYVNHGFPGALAMLFNPFTKENGGIFSQPQGWIILAEALMGHGNRAYEYFTEISPASWNDKAETRVMEPYVHGQFTEATGSPFEGRSHVHWLTGTASTVMVGCVEGILGIRPQLHGISISPAITEKWNEVRISKRFRGKLLNILIKNPEGRESGYKECYLNNIKLENNYIPEQLLEEQNEVVLVM